MNPLLVILVILQNSLCHRNSHKKAEVIFIGIFRKYILSNLHYSSKVYLISPVWDKSATNYTINYHPQEQVNYMEQTTLQSATHSTAKTHLQREDPSWQTLQIFIYLKSLSQEKGIAFYLGSLAQTSFIKSIFYSKDIRHVSSVTCCSELPFNYRISTQSIIYYSKLLLKPRSLELSYHLHGW